MDTSKHNLSSFFSQLGLPNNPQEINAFIANHHLPEGTKLAKADFWSTAQEEFITQALAEDADWAVIADELAVRLTKSFH